MTSDEGRASRSAGFQKGIEIIRDLAGREDEISGMASRFIPVCV
jgi:hypothetical protein